MKNPKSTPAISKKNPPNKRQSNPLDTSYIRFKSTFTKKIQLKFIDSRIDRFYNQQFWDFRKITPDHLRFLGHVEKADCQEINSNQSPQSAPLLKVIASITFSQMLRLTLSENNITSIECIAFLDSPFLESLDVSCNRLINFQPLIKTSFYFLKKLNLEGNIFSHIELGKFNINPQFLTSVPIFDSLHYQDNANFFYDIRSLYMKLESVNFNQQMLYQLCKFKNNIQVLSKKLKDRLATKMAERFKYEISQDKYIYQMLKIPKLKKKGISSKEAQNSEYNLPKFGRFTIFSID